VPLLCAALVACGGAGRDEEGSPGEPQAGAEVEKEPASDALGSAVAGLIRSLGADDDEKRQEAIDALVAMGTPVVDVVAAALTDEDADLRSGAVEVLGAIGGAETVPALLIALQDSSEDVRLPAVEALGKVRDRRAVQPLLDRYQQDEDAQVRLECLTSLGAIGDPQAGPLLEKEAGSEDPHVRVWAVDALCVMNHPRAPEIARASLAESDQPVKRRVLRSCVRALDTAAGHRALIETALHDEDLALAISARLNLVRYLQGEGGSEALAAEIRTAAGEELERDGGDTLRAALLLGELRDPRASTRLIEALGDSNPYARDHAALLLGRIGDPRAVAPLIDLLDDKLPMVRATAHNSLAWFATDGNEQARAAVEAYSGPKFSRPVPR